MRKAPEIALVGMLALAVLFVQACAGRTGSGAGDTDTAQVERINEPMLKDIPQHGLGKTTSRTRPSMRAELSARNETGLPSGLLTDILFDFDRATLREEALPVLQANASFLKSNGVTRLLLEGRADEVGTAAYNLVLGERRAAQVQLYLQELGLPVDLETTSYGKDRPLCFQHSSDCLQKNRSVHFVVKE